MAITSTLVADSATTVYTSTNNSAITWLSFTNYGGATVTISVNIVPNGGSASDTNIVVDELEIASKDTYQWYAGGEKILLEDDDFVSALSNTASSISCTVSYTAI